VQRSSPSACGNSTGTSFSPSRATTQAPEPSNNGSLNDRPATPISSWLGFRTGKRPSTSNASTLAIAGTTSWPVSADERAGVLPVARRGGSPVDGCPRLSRLSSLGWFSHDRQADARQARRDDTAGQAGERIHAGNRQQHRGGISGMEVAPRGGAAGASGEEPAQRDCAKSRCRSSSITLSSSFW